MYRHNRCCPVTPAWTGLQARVATNARQTGALEVAPVTLRVLDLESPYKAAAVAAFAEIERIADALGARESGDRGSRPSTGPRLTVASS